MEGGNGDRRVREGIMGGGGGRGGMKGEDGRIRRHEGEKLKGVVEE